MGQGENIVSGGLNMAAWVVGFTIVAVIGAPYAMRIQNYIAGSASGSGQ